MKETEIDELVFPITDSEDVRCICLGDALPRGLVAWQGVAMTRP